MSSTRKRVYLIVIGVGGVALLVDRFVLNDPATGPKPARAAVNRLDENASAENAGKVPIPEIPFPKNLPDAPPSDALRDIFVRPDNAGATAGSDGAAGHDSKQPEKTKESSQGEFVKRYSLDAVFREADLQVAVVNGHWLRIGDTIGACTLVSIRETAARFRCPDGDAVLDISDVRHKPRD